MDPKILNVKTPNIMLNIKGKLVRTPLKNYIIKTQTELNSLELQLRSLSSQYSLKDYVKPVKKVKKAKAVKVEEKPVEVEKKVPESTLEKIASDIDE